ncbi:MAG: F0F1 ATP synthase subunit A [Bacteroidales bacterium]|nr:F0F1 ATP synthase subunit A [Bacteroidales bacterium]
MKFQFRNMILFLLLVFAATSPLHAEEKTSLDVKSFIFGHTGDSYCFHITEIKGEPVCVWLPVIVHSKESGWHCFSSKHVCELKEGETYKGFYIAPVSDPKYPGKLIERTASGEIKRPFDLSFTKNAFGIFLVCGFMLAFFLPAARKYKKNPTGTPTKYQGLVEWLTYMVLDGIISPSIPKSKVPKFAPYLLTVFFFIFFCNLFGLIPFFPFGANVTGNLSITLVLAFCTYVAVNIFGNKHYWKDILWPDVPLFLKFPIPLMPIIEFVSTLTKPFALMIRLFANILAGHIVIMVLMALIFIIGGMYGASMGGVTSIISIIMMVFMTALECLVAYIQAYVFTMLSSIFIGMAQQEEVES